MRINTLKSYSIKQILDAFNLAFSDYTIPFKLTEQDLNNKIHAENICLEYSVGVFDGNKLVGFILHGRGELKSKSACYNSGTGVIPDYRGQGLTVKMYNYIVPRLMHSAIEQVILEVLSGNTPAIKSYEQAGFSHKRTLNCYKGVPSFPSEVSDFKIERLNSIPWNMFQSFWSVDPSWQNSIQTLKRDTKSIVVYGAYKDNELVSYVVYNPQLNKIHLLATHPNHRNQGAASQLYKHVASYAKTDIKIINIPDTDLSLNQFFTKHGMVNFIQQNEMTLDLTLFTSSKMPE